MRMKPKKESWKLEILDQIKNDLSNRIDNDYISLRFDAKNKLQIYLDSYGNDVLDNLNHNVVKNTITEYSNKLDYTHLTVDKEYMVQRFKIISTKYTVYANYKLYAWVEYGQNSRRNQGRSRK